MSAKNMASKKDDLKLLIIKLLFFYSLFISFFDLLNLMYPVLESCNVYWQFGIQWLLILLSTCHASKS